MAGGKTWDEQIDRKVEKITKKILDLHTKLDQTREHIDELIRLVKQSQDLRRQKGPSKKGKAKRIERVKKK